MRARDHSTAMATDLPLLPHGRPTAWRPMSICDALTQTLSSTTDTGFKSAPCLTRCARERGVQGGACVVAPFPRLRFLFRCGRGDPLSSCHRFRGLTVIGGAASPSPPHPPILPPAQVPVDACHHLNVTSNSPDWIDGASIHGEQAHQRQASAAQPRWRRGPR